MLKQWKKHLISSLIGIAIMFALAGCGADDGNTSDQSSGDTNKTPKQASTVFPLTVTDATGTNVKIKQQPKRIVSLLPSNTEIAFAIGAGKQVVGVTTNDDYPAKVKELPKVGGYKINVEKVLALNPDLVLAQEINKPNAIQKLRSTGIQVVVMKNPSSFKGVYHSVKKIGKITGHKKNAKDVVQNMKATIADVQEKIADQADQANKEIWVEISPPPEMYTSGKGTFMHEMIKTIGASNAAGSLNGYPKVSEEKAIKYNPDYIVLTYGDAKAVNKVLNREGWQDVTAVKKHNVFVLPSDIVSRPGPRLAKGVVQLAKHVYPESFNH